MRDADPMTRRPEDEESVFTARLRASRPVPPRLDRNRLMYLAGQRSAARPRPARIWPALTIASWAACAAVVGLLAARPPEIVTKVRTVERVVEVPVPTPRRDADLAGQTPQIRNTSPESPRLPFGDEFAFDGTGPLTLLSSRPGWVAEEPVAVAEAGPPTYPSPATRVPASYGDLRREWLPAESAGADAFRWF